MPRIIFYAFAKSELIEHLQIESRALLNALQLNQLVLFRVILNPLDQFGFYLLNRLQHRGARRDVMAGRKHRVASELLPRVAGQRIE